METENRGGVGGIGGGRRRRREYGAENVVLVEVPWESVYRGESDELVRRERSLEAEREIGLVVCGEADFGVDGKGERIAVAGVEPPDYFVDRWFEDFRTVLDQSVPEDKACCRMVSVIIYDDAGKAAEFRRLMKLREAAGGCCRVVEDEGLVKDEVEALNREWTRIRGIELEKARKVVEGACGEGGVGGRVLVARIVGDGVKEGKVVKEALSNAVSGCAKPFMVTAVEDEDEDGVKWIVVGGKRKGFADCEAFLRRVDGEVYFVKVGIYLAGGFFRAGDTALIACASMCSALEAHDRREEVRRKAREAKEAGQVVFKRVKGPVSNGKPFSELQH